MNPPYKDEQGRWRTQSLFKETNFRGDFPPIFTLREFDVYDPEKNKTYPSFRRLFLSHSDPTGYTFAKEVLGSYSHWQKLLKTHWFVIELDKWLVELDVKLQSEGMQKIRELAKGESGSAFQAAKYLAEKEARQKVGRPKKPPKEAPVEDSDVEEDFKRIS